MTELEKQEIVSAVIAELEKSGVDFDYKADQAQDDDLVFVIRGTAPDYQGVSVTWKSLLNIITAKAEQAKTDAVSAKDIAQQILQSVTTMKGSVSEMEFSVFGMKASVEEMHSTVVAANNSAVLAANAASSSESNANTYMQNAQQSKTAAETAQGKAEEANTNAQQALADTQGARDTAQGYMESAKQSAQESRDNVERFLPIDFRVTDPNKVILDVNVTGTMEAFVDGMEQEHNDAIALTLEPVVPTVGSHNFGVRGQICIDGNYLYVCVADNEWKKIPLQEL